MKFALVVVVAVNRMIVYTTHVDYYGARGEEGRIAGADEGSIGVFGEQAEKVDSQGFIGVEVAVVSANRGGRGRHFEAFGGGHGRLAAVEEVMVVVVGERDGIVDEAQFRVVADKPVAQEMGLSDVKEDEVLYEGACG